MDGYSSSMIPRLPLGEGEELPVSKGLYLGSVFSSPKEGKRSLVVKFYRQGEEIILEWFCIEEEIKDYTNDFGWSDLTREKLRRFFEKERDLSRGYSSYFSILCRCVWLSL